MRRAILLLLSLVGAVSVGAELTQKQLVSAADYSRSRRGLAFLVVQHEETRWEEYKAAASEVHPIYSGTKSFWAIAAMIAVKERLLTLDERVCETITEWKEQPGKDQIRIRQLLDFSDGIEPASYLHRENIADRNTLAVEAPLVASPGTRFLYGPSHLQIFGEVLGRKLKVRNQTPFDYLFEKVLSPLGLGRVTHKEDSLGHPLLATGFKLNARQWLRLGVMILHRGSYNGVEIVPPDLLRECFQPSTANPAFGIGFWLNREAGNRAAREPDIENLLELKWSQPRWDHVCICRDAAADMIVSLGSGYQRLYVIPSRDLIIVRQGLDTKFSDPAFLRLLLKD